MNNQLKILSILSAICLTITIFLLAYAGKTHETTSTTQQAPVVDYGSSETPIIILDEPKKLSQALGDSARSTTILNQIYSEHYRLTGNLDKHARIDGDISTSGPRTKFTIAFRPSGDKLVVTQTMNNAAMNDYQHKIKKAGN